MGALPEVPLAPGTLVIGDLHLDVEHPAELERFTAFLAGLQAPRLVVLGDLFEYWIGEAQADTDGGRRAVAALAARTRAGTAIDVVPGNRDFLLDARFERASGCRVRRHGLIGLVGAGPGAERVLFLHGDELSTRDAAYQRLRRVLRSAPVRGLARILPPPATRAVARRLRRASRRALSRKDEALTALQPEACRARARAHRATVVCCGHAHRFRDERLPDGPRWLVVDAFGGPLDAVRLEADGRLVPCASGAPSRPGP